MWSMIAFLALGAFEFQTIDPAKIEAAVHDVFDLRPAAIIRDLDLRKPIFKKTAAYGHFGRSEPGFTWEITSKLDAFKAAAGL